MTCLRTTVTLQRRPLHVSVHCSDPLAMRVDEVSSRIKASARKGSEGLTAHASRVSEGMELHVAPKITRPSVTITRLCSLGVSAGWELFYVKEGVYLLSDGNSYKVLKHNGPKVLTINDVIR